METQPNEFDEGTTVLCGAGDNLDEVPRSHRRLITPAIRKIFASPKTYFRGIAKKCQFPKMAEWLRAVTEEDDWKLELTVSKDYGNRAGFEWRAKSVRGATIGLRRNVDLSDYPAEIQHYY